MSSMKQKFIITPKTMQEHEATITVTVHVRYHWRVRLALWLIILGARIGGLVSKVEAEDE